MRDRPMIAGVGPSLCSSKDPLATRRMVPVIATFVELCRSGGELSLDEQIRFQLLWERERS